jgi:hypothetical protein
MTAILRSWRLLILAWAVLLAPQMALVHALSHGVPATSHPHDGDKRHHVAAKVCDTCLSFAQLGAALPSRFDWLALAHARPVLADAATRETAPRHSSAFDARAPPSALA